MAASPSGKADKRLAFAGRELTGVGRDGIAVGVIPRVTQAGRESLHLVVSKCVFLPFGLLVPLGWGQTGAIGEVELPQTVGSDHPERVGLAGGGERQSANLGSGQTAFGQPFDQSHGDTAAHLEGTSQRLYGRRVTADGGVVELLHGVFQPDPLSDPEDPEHSANEAKAGPGQQRGGPDEEREANEGNDWVCRLSLLLEHADNLEVVLQIF